MATITQLHIQSGFNTDVTPQITTLANGDFVVTWSGMTSSNSSEIGVQQFHADGTAVGGIQTFDVQAGFNTDVTPQVTALDGGGYVVSWSGTSTTNGSEIGVQQFDASGTTVGGMQTLDLQSGFSADTDPQVTSLAGGGYVVTWSGATSANSTEIGVQQYDASGTAVGGIKTLDLQAGANTDSTPQVTGLPSGGYVVTWSGNTSTNGSEIGVQQYDASGTAVGGTKTLDVQAGANADTNPQVTTLADGGYVVSWSGTSSTNSSEIGVQQYDASGTAVGSTKTLNLQAGFNADTTPQVTALNGGGYVVAWSGATSTNGSEIGVQQYDASGTAVGGTKTLDVQPGTFSPDVNPEVTALKGGGYVVAWSGSNNTNSSEIGVQQYDASGNPVGSLQTYHLQAGFNTDVTPQVTALHNGGYSVTWSGATSTNSSEIGVATVVCFAAGTLIKTSDGEVRVEDISVGDRVLTLDAGYQKVRWVGSHVLDAIDLAAAPQLRPIRIRAGALAPGMPAQDLLVSPQHRILIRNAIAVRMFDSAEVLIPANKLLALDGIDIAEDVERVEYVHMLFDAHQLVWSNGALSESLFTGPEALKAVPRAARREIMALFPEICAPDFTPTPVRPIPEKGKLMKKLVYRIRDNDKTPVQH